MFRFTIRDVLWLTVVVAVALCWWREHEYFTARDHRDELRKKREQVAVQYRNGVATFVELTRTDIELVEAEIRAANTSEERLDAERWKAKLQGQLRDVLNRISSQ